MRLAEGLAEEVGDEHPHLATAGQIHHRQKRGGVGDFELDLAVELAALEALAEGKYHHHLTGNRTEIKRKLGAGVVQW